MSFDMASLLYVFYETAIISSLMWIISPRLVLRNVKLTLLTIPMIYLYLLLMPVKSVFTVVLFSGFLIVLRYYFFNDSLRLASRQIVAVFVMKFLAFYMASFLILMKNGEFTTYLQLFKSTNIELVQWSLFYLLIIVVQYRVAVNFVTRIRGRSFYLELYVLGIILSTVIFFFAISNFVYRFYAYNINAILSIQYYNIILVLSMNFIVMLFVIIGFLFTTYNTTKVEFSDFQSEAKIDKLTGMLTRVDGLRRLEAVYQKSLIQNSNFVVCFLDVDNLKTINDQYGHHEGDSAIKQISDAVLGQLRGTDFAFRYGGDEFVIVFDNCRIQDARKAWQRVDHQLDIINNAKLNKYKLEVSYGLSSYHLNKKKGLKHIIEFADNEMYKNKRKVK